MATGAAPGVDQRAERACPPERPVDWTHVIAVPLDGTGLARAALGPARALAERLGAEVVLVRLATPARVPGVDADLASQLGETDAYLSLCAEVRHLRAKGVPAREMTICCTDETPAEAIAGAARTAGAALIVMATHGRRGLARAVLGSVAEDVIFASPVPVLLLRPQPNRAEHAAIAGHLGTPGSIGAPIRFLVGFDGSIEARAALPAVAELAVALRAEVGLLRVVAPGSPLLGPWASPSTEGDLAADTLRAAALTLQELGVPAASIRSAVRSGRPVETLLNQAAREQADVLVMAPHPRRPLSLGSATAAVVSQSPIPILVIRRPPE